MISGTEKDYDKRPWGEYQVLLREPGLWVKKIVVRPGKRISLQRHSYREERWIIVKGIGLVTRNKKILNVKEGSCVSISLGDVHRIENTGSEPLVFIEVALGKQLTENDIERIEDDYGRV